MLEGLDRVNWQDLGHAYGPAEDVPELIRALAADDPQERQNARSHLWSNIIHQGTVYSATAPAVPFFLELLAAPAVKDKPNLLLLVTALASGRSYLDVHQHFFKGIPEFQEKMEQPDWDDQLQQELGWVKAARRAVVLGWQVYLQLLDDPDADTRSGAAIALAVCGPHASEIVPRLSEHLVRDPDDRVKASVLLCLGCLAGGDCGALLDAWLKQPVHPGVRASAALSLAWVCRERTPQEAVELLGDCLQNPGPVDELYLQLPWSTGKSVVAAAAQALCELGPAAAPAVVPRIVAGLKNLRPKDSGSIAVVATLLALTFEPRTEPRSVSGLSELQRSVLTSLVESDRAWDYSNVRRILRGFGLPSDRKKMATFLGLGTEGSGSSRAIRDG
jgi:HEAT repeat protein